MNIYFRMFGGSKLRNLSFEKLSYAIVSYIIFVAGGRLRKTSLKGKQSDGIHNVLACNIPGTRKNNITKSYFRYIIL